MDNKRKGGAERERDKKRRLLEAEAGKCKKISDLFGHVSVSAGPSASFSASDALQADEPLVELEQDKEIIGFPTAPNTITAPSTSFAPTVQNPVDAQYIELQEIKPACFTKPGANAILDFFKKHPLQPQCLKNGEPLPFNHRKVFFRENNLKRQWLSFCEESQKLFCTVCIAYSKIGEINSFTIGMNDWRHVHQRITEHDISNKHVECTRAYLLSEKGGDIDTLLFRSQKSVRETQVRNKRDVLERVIDIIKLIGKRGLSYRGKSHEAAYTLDNHSLDHGNFLEMLLLLSKYDVTLNDHIVSVINKSKLAYARRTQEGNSKGRGGLITLFSKTTLSYVIDAISKLIKQHICNEVRESGMYSIQIDTTQDCTVQDQCSVVIRYVTDKVHERLISMVNCKSSTGKSFFELLRSELQNNNISIQNCIGNSTDGAANMQGQYKGFTTWLDAESPGIHVWCYGHVLNLVIADVTQSPIEAASLFGLLNSIAVFLRESYKRMDVWITHVSDARKKRLSPIGDTRWWAKSEALKKVFGSYGGTDTGLFVELVETLDCIAQNKEMDSKSRFSAKAFVASISEFATILTAQVYLRIFQNTTPLSKYLQTSDIDLLKAHQMVTVTLNTMKDISRDFSHVKQAADIFVKSVNNSLEDGDSGTTIVVQSALPAVRTRAKKRMPGEKAGDDPIIDAIAKFRVEVYNNILDKVVTSLETRFSKHEQLYAELSSLDPKTFKNNKSVNDLPKLQKMVSILNKIYPNVTVDNLRDELFDFSNKWNALQGTVPDEYSSFSLLRANLQEDEVEEVVHESTSGINLTFMDVEEDGGRDELKPVPIVLKSCKGCASCAYQVLLKYNLFSQAYSNIYLAYKFLLTLSTTQVACERSFSILKYVKNRLRSTMSQDQLEAFMLMACEKDVLNRLDCSAIIDEVSKRSELLKRQLIYGYTMND